MKTKDIKVGRVYASKVGRNTTPVRIMRAAEGGGWEAVTLTGSKPVTIKSVDRLVGPHNPKKKPTSAQGGKSGTKPRKPTSQAKKATKSKRGPTSPKVKRASALDSAVRVLSESKEPQTCKQMIETMLARDYWKPSQGGKTPANTLYAAILKETNTKGKDARFQKDGRGQFALAGA